MAGTDKRTEGDRTPAAERLVDRLRQVVQMAGSIGTLSRHAAVSQRTIGRALAGHPVKRGTLLLIAEGGGVIAEWLMTGRGPMRWQTDAPPAPSNAVVEQGETPPQGASLPELGEKFVEDAPEASDNEKKSTINLAYQTAMEMCGQWPEIKDTEHYRHFISGLLFLLLQPGLTQSEVRLRAASLSVDFLQGLPPKMPPDERKGK